MIRTEQGMSHIHLWVADLDRSIRFYSEVFGMTERFRAGDRLVSLATPGSRDSISLNHDPDGIHPTGDMGSIAHFGFRLSDPNDLDTALDQVVVAGGSVVNIEEQPNARRSAYVADPDGYLIEL